MSNFDSYLSSYNWDELREQINSISAKQVEQALDRAGQLNFTELLALLSPAAKNYIPKMAELAHQLTIKRFGRVVQLFVPVYLSNECQNICTHCGFSVNNKIKRLTLNPEQIDGEIRAIKKLGFEHVLIVTGESHKVNLEYFLAAIKQFKGEFAQVSFEVQPLEQDDYTQLVDAGMHALMVYQETYHRQHYKIHHPKGKKSDFTWRLDTPERAAAAGVAKIGLGVLLGLEDWRTDAACLALHIDYLKKRFWKTKFSVSFPRLRPAEGVQHPAHVSQSELVQLILALRLFDENLELSISTREDANFRDLAPFLGITSMSAASKTEPGGYALKNQALEQFSTDDKRTSDQVASALRAAGFEAVWKDWQPEYRGLASVALS